MIQHLRLLNPSVGISTETEARTAARAGAVGAFIGVAFSIYSAIYMLLNAETMLAAMRKSMAATSAGDPAVTAMAEAMLPGIINFSVSLGFVFAVVGLILGIVQWLKLTRVIPLLLLLFILYGLSSSVLALLVTPAAAKPDIQVPVLQTVVSYVGMVVQALLYITALRGASFLHSAKRRAAEAAA